MPSDKLPHATYIEKQLAVGHRAEAERAQREHIDAQRERAEAGEVINLSDMLAGAEALHIDSIEKGRRPR